MGTLPFQGPLADEVAARAPASSGFERFKSRPGLLGHLPGQRLQGMAALHGVGMGAQTGFFPQHVLDVSGPSQRPGVFLALGLSAVVRPEVVGTDFQPVHASHHGCVGRHGVGQQRITAAFGVQPEGGGLGLQAQGTGIRAPHLAQQTVPHGTRRTGQCDARQHVGADRHPHCRMLGRGLQ